MNFKIKKSEFDHFSDLASEWWLKNGKFKILHEIQPIRIKYIQDVINKKTLNKLSILDLGCGWGSFSLYAAQKFPNSNLRKESFDSSGCIRQLKEYFHLYYLFLHFLISKIFY